MSPKVERAIEQIAEELQRIRSILYKIAIALPEPPAIKRKDWDERRP